ncbi:DUF1573 domain-containing protein [uncultured Bacteroides sp.]|jgi:hypothetical protein|uniref:DUF1573 domain-containing protein n=1 Tax=uncultured Bacteroides sp. TaxID=162156 RepID=UPI002583AB8C|nr:DUF1573 domain-containing protein [uncultured Bacteroides sp.]
MKYIVVIVLLFLVSCKDDKRARVLSLLEDWNSKEFIFPSNLHFTINGDDSIDYRIQNESKYKVVIYVDSTGCTSCKLRLSAWQEFMEQVDSLTSNSVQFLFFFFPKNKTEISNILITDRFKYPVCIDEQDSLNILNHIPTETMFQTFLLDRNNRVVSIGNPIHNPKIKELYLSIITGKDIHLDVDNQLLTTVDVSAYQLDMGTFDWEKEQCVEFIFTNSGKNAFIIEDVSTSCGCTTVEYSKEPIRLGKRLIMSVKYKAEHPEHFNKTITVYSNAEGGPFLLKITGNAK